MGNLQGVLQLSEKPRHLSWETWARELNEEYKHLYTTPAPKDTNPKTQYGLAKPSLTNVPPVGLFEVGRVMALGAEKYGSMNWRDDPVSYSTYVNGALRHLLEAWDGNDFDFESQLPHLAHAAANLLILLDAKAQGTLFDDRPTAGTLGGYLKTHTKPIESDPA